MIQINLISKPAYQPIMVLLGSLLWVSLALLALFVTAFIPHNVFGQMCNTHRSFAMGIVVDLPCRWIVEEQNEVVSLVSPDEGGADRILETVDVSVFPTYGSTHSDFADFLKTDFYPNNLGSNFRILEDTTGIINGHEAGIFVYEYFDEELGVTLQAMDVLFEQSNFIYQLTLTADKNSYMSYLPLFDEILNSFEIINIPVGPTDSETSELTGGIGK